MQALIDHTRTHKEFLFVYPVVSRRSNGISLGVNLSPHRQCNFDCLYCEVDRSPDARSLPKFSNTTMIGELKELINSVLDGSLFEQKLFNDVPQSMRRLNDIAFSGDGEPTAEPVFLEACQSVSELKNSMSLDDVKIVLISNSTMFHKPDVQKGLAILEENKGEIWAKLDAGTENYYNIIDKTHVPFKRVLDNILLVAQKRPIIIQTLFTVLDGVPISKNEVLAYANRLKEIKDHEGLISEVHLHTLARPPAYSRVESLTKNQLDEMAGWIKSIIDIPVTTFAGRAG